MNSQSIFLQLALNLVSHKMLSSRKTAALQSIISLFSVILYSLLLYDAHLGFYCKVINCSCKFCHLSVAHIVPPCSMLPTRSVYLSMVDSLVTTNSLWT